MEGGRATLGHILGGRSGALEPACLSRHDCLVVPVAENRILDPPQPHQGFEGSLLWPTPIPTPTLKPLPQALAPHRASSRLGVSTWGHCKPREAKLGWFSFLPTHSSSFFLRFLLWFVTPSFIHAISQARKLRAVLRCPVGPLGNPLGPSGLSLLPLLLG